MTQNKYIYIYVSFISATTLKKGCYKNMTTYLPSLVPYFIEILQSENSIVEIKSISCWVLQRYAKWICDFNCSSSSSSSSTGDNFEAMKLQLFKVFGTVFFLIYILFYFIL